MSTINLLENTSQSWYDAGYVNVRRRYASGLSFLANYTFAKSLENAPDFRSPMFEAATPQNNDDLNAEKGPGCDIRHRFALSAVYSSHAVGSNHLLRALSRDWRGSWSIQVADRLPLHRLGLWRHGQRRHGRRREPDPRQPDRAEDLRLRHAQLHHLDQSQRPSQHRLPTPTAMSGRNSVYGPGLQTMDLGSGARIQRWLRRLVLRRAQSSSTRSITPTWARRTGS